MKVIMFLAIGLICLVPATAWAKGHGDCNSCHLNTEQENYDLVTNPSNTIINPFTSKPYGQSDALCMGCHNQFKAKSVHPVGIVPKKIVLPPEAKGFTGQEEQITCFSCHDPHPENKNYMYLRWPTDKGANISKFCVAKCHSQFAKPKIALNRKIKTYF